MNEYVRINLKCRSGYSFIYVTGYNKTQIHTVTVIHFYCLNPKDLRTKINSLPMLPLTDVNFSNLSKESTFFGVLKSYSHINLAFQI